MRALEPPFVAAALARATTPSPSDLFLFWQVLSTRRPEQFREGEREAISTLARTAQTTSIDAAAWSAVHGLCMRTLGALEWPVVQDALATFLLP